MMARLRPLALLAAAAALGGCDDGTAADDGAITDTGAITDADAVTDATPDAAMPDAPVDMAAPDAADAAPTDAGPTPEERVEAARLADLTPLEGVEQPTGDPAAGWDYVRYGGFLGSGIPYSVFSTLLPDVMSNPLDREGPSATVPYPFNVFEAFNGVEVVGGVTCLGCHAGRVNGQFVPGLGNALSDYTPSDTLYRAAEGLVIGRHGGDSPEAEIMRIFTRGASATGAATWPPFSGLNPAFAIEYAAAAHREPETLAWRDEPAWDRGDGPLASDVPPLWHVRKKHALYYNGMGRGDFGRAIQQIVVVTLPDASHGGEFAERAGDVLAWIRGLEPPPWPRAVDAELAEQGRTVFEATCSGCHGTYGEPETYPNLLVPVEVVGTDATYARRFVERPELTDWFDRSWFADGAWMEPLMGYVAPPLDGIWATAPYLHNGAVPTLAALLDSSTRPTWFRRDYGSSAYDFDAVGWPHTALDGPEPGDRSVYDTTVEGYGNQGHTFADGLTADDRRALLEYLKTL